MIRANTVKRNNSSTSSGALDEEYFNKAFNEIIDVHIFSSRDMESHLLKIRECIGNSNTVWNKHIEALRMFRGLVAAGAANFEEFFTHLRLLGTSFESILRDLRSQVIKEACVTIAYLSKKLENKIDTFAEYILPHLIVLLISSKKVISSSAMICLRILLQHTHSIKFITIIINNVSSKSKVIRRAMYEFIALILYTWERISLDKYVASLKQVIKKGIMDADTEVRSYSRKAYWVFYERYEEQANKLMQHLHPTFQRTLQHEKRGSHDIPSCIAWKEPSGFTINQPPHHQGMSESNTKLQKNLTTSLPPNSSDIRPNLQLEHDPKPESNTSTDLVCPKVGTRVSLPCLRKDMPEKVPRNTTAGQNRFSRFRSRLSALSQVQPRVRSGSVPSRNSFRELYKSNDSQIFDTDNRVLLKNRSSRKSINDISKPMRDSEVILNKNTDYHTDLQYDNYEVNTQSCIFNGESSSNSRNQMNFPSLGGKLLTVIDRNGFDTFYNYNQMKEFDIQGQKTSGKMIESEAVRKILELFDSPVKRDGPNLNYPISNDEKKISLNQLVKLIREIHCSAIIYHFKSILRLLLAQLCCNENESSFKLLALASLTELIKRSDLADSFKSFVELIVLKILQSFKDESKEVQKSAEICAATAASMLAPDLLIGVLVPLITIEDYPVNLGAIKTLTIFVETRGQEHVRNYLSDLASALIKAYDHKVGSVRKSALFCLVALHNCVGEKQLIPHLNSLDEKKLKLLRLYIDKAQQATSFSNFPKHQSTRTLSSWTP